jgi:hypothetical protein
MGITDGEWNRQPGGMKTGGETEWISIRSDNHVLMSKIIEGN